VAAEPAEVQRIHEEDRLRPGACLRKPQIADDARVGRLEVHVIEADAMPVVRFLGSDRHRLTGLLRKLERNRHRARLRPFGRANEFLHRHVPIAPQCRRLRHVDSHVRAGHACGDRPVDARKGEVRAAERNDDDGETRVEADDLVEVVILTLPARAKEIPEAERPMRAAWPPDDQSGDAEQRGREADETVQELSGVTGEQIRVQVEEPLQPLGVIVIPAGDLAGVLIDVGVDAMALVRFGPEVPGIAWSDFAPARLAQHVARRCFLDPRRQLVDRQALRSRFDICRAGSRDAIELVAEDDDGAGKRDDADDGPNDQSKPEMDLEQPSP